MYLVKYTTINNTYYYKESDNYANAFLLCQSLLKLFAIKQVAIYYDNGENFILRYKKIKEE